LILVDTSALLALLDRDARHHDNVESFVAENDESLVLSPFVLAELDYLVAERFGIDAELGVLDDISEGAYELAPFSADDVARARTIIVQYRDLRIGLADASLVVLAERTQTNRVLTLDERHFRALRVGRRRFIVLPADA
jgi:predicted nucleic acid-binding protein